LGTLQAFAQFLKVRDEPHLLAAVGFGHEVSERTTASDVLRDVAKDHQSPSLRHAFLHDLTSKTGVLATCVTWRT
jgi:hypothetical protein